MKTTNFILTMLFFAVLGTVLSLAINIEPSFGLLLTGVAFLPMPTGVIGFGLIASPENVTALLGKQTAPADIGYPIGAALVPKGEEFDTDALALVGANWLNNINSIDAIRWRVLPFEYNIEPTKEDDAYATSSTGNIRFANAGKTTMKFFVTVTPFVKSQLNNLNGIDWDIFIFTSNGFIEGTSADGTKFQPRQLQNFRVEGETLIDLINVVPIVWTYLDPAESNSRPSFLQPLKDGDFNVRDINDPKAILSAVTNGATTGFDIVLQGYDDVPFTGAKKEDVVIENVSTGVLTALTTLTESSTVPGTYVAVATIPAATYYIGMAPVGTATATQGFAGLRSDLIKEEFVIA
jgi:hypothetical protein